MPHDDPNFGIGTLVPYRLLRLLDHLPGARIDVGQEPVDLHTAGGADFESGLADLGEEVRIFHSGVEGCAQRDLAILRNAGRGEVRPPQALPCQQHAQDLPLLVTAREVADQRNLFRFGVLLLPEVLLIGGLLAWRRRKSL